MEDGSVSLREHLETIIELNDRRYTEVNLEKEKALKIKEEGDKEAMRIKDESDKKALELQTETQKYKDEKANELREQINGERNLYVTKEQLSPILEYVNSQQGRSSGLNSGWGYLVGGIGLVIMVITFFNK